MLLSSSKFESKAQEVMGTVLEAKPKHVKLEKKLENLNYGKVTLEGLSEGQGGMMLYTSGTTNRPVSFFNGLIHNTPLQTTERSPASPIRLDSTIEILDRSLGLQPSRPSSSCPPTSSHSRHRKCHPCSPILRLHGRVPLPIQCHSGLATPRRTIRAKPPNP